MGKKHFWENLWGVVLHGRLLFRSYQEGSVFDKCIFQKSEHCISEIFPTMAEYSLKDKTLSILHFILWFVMLVSLMLILACSLFHMKITASVKKSLH